MSLKRFRGAAASNVRTDPNSSRDGRSGLGDRARGRVLYEAVVVDIFSNPEKDLEKNPINDPDLTYRESLTKGVNRVKNIDLVLKMPRRSITAIVTSDKDAWSGGNAEIFYPLFPHFSMPIKPGEKVWIIYETLNRGRSNRGYWISRVTSDINVDDPNYTHLDREYLYTQVPREPTALGESPWDDELIFSFLGGGTGNSSQNSLPGDDPYNGIVGTSFSYAEQFNGEPVPRFSPRVGDLFLEGSNNTLICLGQDRPSMQGPDEDLTGEKGIGAIDIVVGRGQSEDTKIFGEIEIEKRSEDLESYYEGNKFPTYNDAGVSNEGEGNPDFLTDLSRIYVSMKTNGDENFGLNYTYTGQVPSSPYVVAKSTEIRLEARGSVRAKSEAGAEMLLMSSGESALIGERVFLGSPGYEHTGYGQAGIDSGHEHIVKGDSLWVAFQKFLEDVTIMMTTVVGNNGYPIAGLNTSGEFTTIIETLVGNIEDSLSDVVHTE